MRIALLFEHPTWSDGLIARARERNIDLTPINVGDLTPKILAGEKGFADLGPFDVWVNRVNAMPSAGRSPSVVAATGHLLTMLEIADQHVINGSQTHRIGGSKLAQAALFTQLGLDTPASIGISTAEQAPAAAAQLGFPVLTKPNVGGSGSSIARHDSPGDLQAALANDALDLGIDGTGLVQRVIASADGLIHRIEMLGTDLFYGTQQPLQTDAFNYCAADGCAVESDGKTIALFTPDDATVEAAAAIMTAADTSVGGVEYLIDATSGRPAFFDFNPYSNFISGYDAELGFDPIDRYLDFLLSDS